MSLARIFTKTVIPTIGALALTTLLTVATPPASADGTYNCNGTDSSQGTYTVTGGVPGDLRGCTSSTLVLASAVTTLNDSTYIPDGVITLVIPASVTTINQSPFTAGFQLREYQVDANNPNFTSIDGVFMSKDGTRLISYPPAKLATTWAVPPSVTSLATSAFSTNMVLETLTVGAGVTSGLESAFNINGGGGTLAYVDVDHNNPNYSSLNGVVFNKDQSIIYYYPQGKMDESYTIPSTVTEIYYFAFTSSHFSSVQLPQNLLKIERQGFFSDTRLVNVSSLPASIDLNNLSFELDFALADINVDSNHLVADPANPLVPLPALYSSVDGVLFSADGTTLVEYPGGKVAKTYEIPEGVRHILTNWTANMHLNRITIPSTETDIGSAYLPNLRAVTIRNMTTFGIADEVPASDVFIASNNFIINDSGTSPYSLDAHLLRGTTTQPVVFEQTAPQFSLTNLSLALTSGVPVDDAHRYQIATTGAFADWYSISPDPTSYGLHFDTSSGLISGTPTGAFTSTFTITGSNTVGDTDVTFTISSSSPTPPSSGGGSGGGATIGDYPDSLIFPNYGDVGGGTLITMFTNGGNPDSFTAVTLNGTPAIQLDSSTCNLQTPTYGSGSSVNPHNGYCFSPDGTQMYFVSPPGVPGVADLSVLYDGTQTTFSHYFAYTQNRNRSYSCSDSGKVAEWNYAYLYAQNSDTFTIGDSTCGNVNLSLANSRGYASGGGLQLTPGGLAFDGVNWLNSYGKIPSSLIGTNTPYTIAAWITNPNLGIAQWGIVDQCGDFNAFGYFPAAPPVAINYWCLDSSGATFGADIGSVANPVRLLVATYDGETRTLYLDGVPVSSNPASPSSDIPSGTPSFAQGSLVIGNSLIDYTQSGTLGDLAIFDRALNDTEVANLQPSTPQNLPVTITAPLAGSSLNGTVGQSFTTTITHSDGVAPFAFAAIGNLPPGLLLDSTTGIISGTPTTAGDYTVSLSVASHIDESGTVDIATVDNITFSIAAGSSTPTTYPIVITDPISDSTYTGTVGNQFSATVASSGGVGSLTTNISQGTLPNGLTLDPATGIISGTPQQSGLFAVSITVSGYIDESGTVGSRTVSFVHFNISPASQLPPAPSAGPSIDMVNPQISRIESVELGCDATASPIVLKGSFPDKVVNIELNGKMLDAKQWVQTSTTLTITPPEGTAGEVTIQIYNGAAPLLKLQKIYYVAACTPPAPTPTVTPTPVATPVATPTPSPTPTPKPATIVVKKPVIKIIVCIKGRVAKTVKGTNPKCPKGYTLKKKK